MDGCLLNPFPFLTLLFTKFWFLHSALWLFTFPTKNSIPVRYRGSTKFYNRYRTFGNMHCRYRW